MKAALATVVKVERSGPLGPGTSVAISEDGQVVGSVSGGCVEPAGYEEAMVALESGTPKLLSQGIPDDEAVGGGPAGGRGARGLRGGDGRHRKWHAEATLLRHLRRRGVRGGPDLRWDHPHLRREGRLVSLIARWHALLREQSPVAIATVIEGPGNSLGGKLLVTPDDHGGGSGNEDLDRAIVEAARGLLEGSKTETRHFGPRGQRRMEDVAVFIQSFAPPPKMYVFGAIDFASAVARIGTFLGYAGAARA